MRWFTSNRNHLPSMCLIQNLEINKLWLDKLVSQLLGAATGAFSRLNKQPAPRGLQERIEWHE